VLDTDAGSGDGLDARLRRFKLRVKAELTSIEWVCLAVRGTVSVAAGDAVPGAVLEPRLPGVDLLGPAEAVQVPTGVRVVAIDAYEVVRIEEGVPRMGAELTDRTIPAEAGIVDRTVSFAKGCFTGQELVARIDSRGGHVPRRLRGLRASRVAAGDPLLLDGRAVGTVTSAVEHPEGGAVALAYVHRDVEPPAEVELPGGEVAQVQALPLLS
jgi:tRNA-modifying protein YgfZ